MVIRQREGGVTFEAECGALFVVECLSVVWSDRGPSLGVIAVGPWRTLMAGQSGVSNFPTIAPATTVYPESQRTISMKAAVGLVNSINCMNKAE